jgi:hypothetical protein
MHCVNRPLCLRSARSLLRASLHGVSLSRSIDYLTVQGKSSNMNSTLIPERPLLISPTLAATIGLEETVMLHVLGELIAMQHALAEPSADQQRWVELDPDQLQRVLPFWAPIDIRRIQSNLRELGLLKISEGLTQNAQRFEIDDGVKVAQTPKSPPPWVARRQRLVRVFQFTAILRIRRRRKRNRMATRH